MVGLFYGALLIIFIYYLFVHPIVSKLNEINSRLNNIKNTLEDIKENTTSAAQRQYDEAVTRNPDLVPDAEVIEE